MMDNLGVNDAGACHGRMTDMSELTGDPDKGTSFCKSLFGRLTQDSTGRPVRCVEFSSAGASIPSGGLLQMDPQSEGVPACRGIYWMAACADPAGAMFSAIHLFS